MGFIDKKHFIEIKDYFFDEILSMAMGWIAGLFAVNIMTTFFEKRSWSNLWGVWTDKIAVDESVFTMSEWIVTATCGFIVMKVVNKLFSLIIKKED